MNRRDTLKSRIEDKKPVFGTFLKNSCQATVEMIGFSGFDFVIIDCEHSNFSYSEMENVIRACEVADMASIVRIPSCDTWHIHHALETGATGVQIPSISSVDDAKRAAMKTVFFPDGTRSPAPAVRAANYGLWSGEKSYLQSKSESNLTVVHIESLEMASEVEKLSEIPQIDVFFIGPGDLSMSMGKPGKLNDPEVVKVIEDIIQRGLSGGKAMGMLCGNAEAVKKYIDLGVTYISYLSDVGIMAGALRNISQTIFDPYR